VGVHRVAAGGKKQIQAITLKTGEYVRDAVVGAASTKFRRSKAAHVLGETRTQSWAYGEHRRDRGATKPAKGTPINWPRKERKARKRPEIANQDRWSDI